MKFFTSGDFPSVQVSDPNQAELTVTLWPGLNHRMMTVWPIREGSIANVSPVKGADLACQAAIQGMVKVNQGPSRRLEPTEAVVRGFHRSLR